MSLQGTLETFALPDVLTLLASTNKTGQLHVEGSSNGHIWLEAGQVVGYDVAGAATLVDAVFELLRLRTGTFSFGSGAAPAPADPSAVEVVLTEARSRLADWRGIEAVVPSTRCPVHLVADLGEDTVTLSRAQWKVLVAVAASSDVAGVMTALEMGEFDACRTVKDLVQAGLAKVGPAPTAPANVGPAPTAPAPAKVDPAPTAPAPPAVTAPTAPVSITTRPAAPPVAEPSPPPAPPVAERRLTPTPPAREQIKAVRPQPRPSPVGREEAEEMVHQLASLSSSSTGDANGRPGGDTSPPAPAPPAQPDATTTEQPPSSHPETVEARPEEEPINRGMLLKFLSSVRT